MDWHVQLYLTLWTLTFYTHIFYLNLPRLHLSRTYRYRIYNADLDTVLFLRQVSERIINDTLSLVSCILAFRGHRKVLGEENAANFLSIIELLSRYDHVLKELVSRPESKNTQCKILKGRLHQFSRVSTGDLTHLIWPWEPVTTAWQP